MRPLLTLTSAPAAASLSDRLWEAGRELLVIALPIAAPALIAWLRARRKRRNDKRLAEARRAAAEVEERAYFRRVLMAQARAIQVLLEESIARDTLRASGRFQLATDSFQEGARVGSALERKTAALEVLNSTLESDPLTEPPPHEPHGPHEPASTEQDVLPPDQLEVDER